jgi:hypothetical protein
MAETLDQKVGMFALIALLSNLSGIPFLRGEKRDGRMTWNMPYLVSAENAGSSKQGHTCMMTEAQ